MAIKEKITSNIELSYFEGRIPMQYRYTYGIAGDRFFRGLKEGKLIGSRAKQSGIVYCPPRIFCEESFEEIDDIVNLNGKGEVESFTVCFEDLHGMPQLPEIIALVKFDGADTGFAAPLKCDLEEACIGMRVKLSYVPKNRRKGSINDVYFEPTK